MDNNFKFIKVMKVYGFDNGRAYRPGDLLFFHPDYGNCYSDGQPFSGKNFCIILWEPLKTPYKKEKAA